MGNLLEVYRVELDTLERAPYGLFSLGDPESTQSDHWLNGFTVESMGGKRNVYTTEICDDTQRSGSGLDVNVVSPAIVVDPLVITVDVTCSTFGFKSFDFEGRALAVLKAVAERELEHQLWAGPLTIDSDDRYILDNIPAATLAVTGSATGRKVRSALAALEAHVGEFAADGGAVIHVPRDIASLMPLHDDGHGKLRTSLGTRVLAGTGYFNSPPGGGDPGTTGWMYLTGDVIYTLGEPDILNKGLTGRNVDYSVNSVVMTAQQTAAATYLGAKKFAASFDLTADYA